MAANSKYDIRISEAQRHYLLVALWQCQAQGHYGADSEGIEEIDALEAMLHDDTNLQPLHDPNGKHLLNVLNDFTA